MNRGYLSAHGFRNGGRDMMAISFPESIILIRIRTFSLVAILLTNGQIFSNFKDQNKLSTEAKKRLIKEI